MKYIWIVLMLTTYLVLADNQAEMKSFKAKSWEIPTLGIKLNLIEPGTFEMGSVTNQLYRRSNEQLHAVEISKPFYMGIYEVTQRQFYQLMMPNYNFEAWQFKRGPIADGLAFCYRYPTKDGLIFRGTSTGGARTDLNPMESLSWARAQQFCQRITKIEKAAGRLPAGYVYRLPTEAEWEYACRAGSSTPFNVDIKIKDIKDVRKFAWVTKFSGVNMGSRVVGTRLPNAWGLYDMHGNVYEWCHDWYAPYPKSSKTLKDPQGPKIGQEKVVRGGCFSGLENDITKDVYPFLRSASRYSFPPKLEYLAIVGFRIVLAPSLGLTE